MTPHLCKGSVQGESCTGSHGKRRPKRPKNAGTIRKVITRELPERLAADEKNRNAMANSDRENARIEHNAALRRIIRDEGDG